MALRPEKPSNLVRRPSTRSIVGAFERVLTVSRNLQEKTGELASKLKVLEARVHEIRPSINPSLAPAIDAAVRGDEKAQKIVRESESKVPLCQKRAVAAYTAASHSLFRVLADTAALEETKTECALLVSQALSLFQVVEGKQNPNTIDRPSISEIVKSVKGLETRQEEEEEEEEEKEKAMPFPRLSRKKAKHGLSAPLHAKGDGTTRDQRVGKAGGVKSNRLSMSSRSSQRTDNAGMLNRLALYHDRLKTEQARLEKLEDEFRELKREITTMGARKELERYLADKIEKEDIEHNFDGCDEEDQILGALRIASDMKEARVKIEKTEGKIEEFESGGGEEGESISRFSGSVWESLGCALPRIPQHVSQTVSSTAVISENYIFAPASVIKVDIGRFMKHCIDEGFVSKLQEEATSLNVDSLLCHSMQSLFLRSESSIGLCFSQVFQAVTSVLPVEEGTGSVQLGYTSDYPVKDGRKALKPDFVVGTIIQDQAHLFDVSLVGELKGLGSSNNEFFDRWCSADANHDECTGSERHHPVSPIRQLYNYMVQSGKFVGVYSNYMFTAAFFRDCEGNLATTPMLPGRHSMTRYGLSIPQFLALVTMIALKGEVPQFLDDRGKGILVSCTGSEGCTMHGRSVPHTDLPRKCKWDQDQLQTQNRGGGGGLRGGARGVRRNNLLYKEHDTPITWGDLYECKHISDCYTGSAVECEIMGERAVVKYDDFGDHEDADWRLNQIDFEAEVYANLSDLQGDCIPKYLGHGSITDTDGLPYGFATSYAGEPLSYESLDSLTEEFKTSVKDALDKIHARGVLHGDLRLPNILKSKDDPEKAIFIDFSHSGIYDDLDGRFFQVRARLEKENLVKLLKGEKIKQVF